MRTGLHRMGVNLLFVGAGCSLPDRQLDDDGITGLTFGLDTDGSVESDDSSGTGDGDCVEGSACEGGVCAVGACCPVIQACGALCCGDGQVCSFGQCRVPGSTCEGAEDCDEGEYCEFALGSGDVTDDGCIGSETLTGMCLPLPPLCEGNDPLGPGGLPTCVEACEIEPDSSDMSTVLVQEVEGPGYTAPIVIQLDDDDCDGQITAHDIPEIVWNMHTGANYTIPTNGRIKAVSIVGGQVVEKFTYDSVLPVSQVAGGNIDGNGANGNEIVVCASDSSVVALDGAGNLRWKALPGTCATPYAGDFDLSVPSIADLDEDGVPEVITELAILDGASGTLEASYAAGFPGTVAVSDVDGDGWLDIVSGGKAFDRTGALIANTGIAGLIWPAVGDLDGDGRPEIVGVNFNNRSIAIWRVTNGAAEVVRPALSLNSAPAPACPQGSAGSTRGGGAPTIGDFDGDGTADVALAAGNAYVVFDGQGLMNPSTPNAQTVLWWSPTNDCSSAQTGSTLFDFDGNGRVEAVYGDETLLHIYDGLTGMTLDEHPHPTGTLNEYPVVADVDADGQADIVAITRSTCGEQACGSLRVYGSASGGWVRTRRIWNQYTYHVTNIEEDGTIPQDEIANWTVDGLNNFRQNKQPGEEFSATDATVSLQPACFGGYSLQATVRNLGQAPLPAGAVVAIRSGVAPNGELLGVLETTVALYPAQAQVLSLPLDMAPDVDSVYATVSSEVAECDMDNNNSEPVTPTCIPVG